MLSFTKAFHFFTLALSATGTVADRYNEIKIREDAIHNSYENPEPHKYIKSEHLPESFNWGNVDGVSYLTHSLNQHIPQYCGSCWAHGAMSSFADRIKIARNAQGDDINLAIQFILNCGTEMAGSCHGGYHTGTFEFIKLMGYVPYDTCQPYLACSEESTEGFCPHVDTTCSASGICRTCNTFEEYGGFCSEIDYFPNATIAEYGMIAFDEDIVYNTKAEIFARGPVAVTVNAEPILEYGGGIFTDDSYSTSTNHIVSIVGWGFDEVLNVEYWIVRNSWGQYWGEMGYFRIETGKNLLGIEGEIAWATPGSFTVHNLPCNEDGSNCVVDKNDRVAPGLTTQHYVDPSDRVEEVQRRLSKASKSKEGNVRK